MIGDVGLESLPALSELEELNLGVTRITGTNLNFLKLLPKLKKQPLSRTTFYTPKPIAKGKQVMYYRSTLRRVPRCQQPYELSSVRF